MMNSKCFLSSAQNLLSDKWDYVGNSAGPALGCRSGHSWVVIGQKVYLFGGCGGDVVQSTASNQTMSFDFDSNTWANVQTKGHPPAPRASHGMCSDGVDSFFILGGRNQHSITGDMFKLNVRSKTWVRVESSNEAALLARNRYGHSLTKYKNNLILFGGCNDTAYFSDVHKFSLETFTWEVLDTFGEVPSPRFKHEAFIPTTFDSDSLYVVGGGDFLPEAFELEVFKLNLCSLFWEQVVCSGEVPARVAFGGCYDPFSQEFFIFGGIGADQTWLSDFQCLHLQTKSWSQVKISRGPSERGFHTVCCFNGSIFIYGGTDANCRFCDIWKYDFRAQIPSLITLAAKQVSPQTFIAFFSKNFYGQKDLWNIVYKNFAARY